jgi:hypothetical protein
MLPVLCKLMHMAYLLAATAATAAAAAAGILQVHGVQLVQTDLVASLMPRLAGAVDLLVGAVLQTQGVVALKGSV